MRTFCLLISAIILGSCSEKAAGPADAGGGYARADSGVADDTIHSDEEREKYVQANLEVTGLDVTADFKPDGDGGTLPVGGMLRVAGVVKNRGPQSVRNARITVLLYDANDKVIGTYFHDVAGNKRLGPGEERAFRFPVPEKKEYAGKFTYSLR